MSNAPADQVLAYWFGDDTDWLQVVSANKARWFQHGSGLDEEIRARFAATVEAARAGGLQHWRQQAASCLALVLCLDQFPRHLFRGRAEAFASDPQALEVCRAAIDSDLDKQLSVVQRSFFYLPLEHAEDGDAQALSIKMFSTALADAPAELEPYMGEALRFARAHQDIVQRFGRFPHRNDTMGRPSTAEEASYLASGGQRFGQRRQNPNPGIAGTQP